MDFDFGKSLAESIARGVNAAVDITIAREIAGTPGFLPNVNQTTVTQQVAADRAALTAAVSDWAPVLLLIAGAVVVFKLATKG